MGENFASQVNFGRNSIPSFAAISRAMGISCSLWPNTTKLPCEFRNGRLIAVFIGIDRFDVTDDLVEIAANAIFPVTFGRGTVDGAGDHAHPVFDQAFENFVSDVIEIGPIRDRNGDVFFMRIFENLQQLRIEKDFAVIRNFHLFQRRVRIQQLAEILEFEKSTPDRGMDMAARRRTRRTSQLAK